MADYNEYAANSHIQLYDNSCVPSSVEMVLKQLGKVSLDYCELQEQWKSSPYVDASYWDGKQEFGLRFKSEYLIGRGSSFPINGLFARIDEELNAGRFVIVSLQEGWAIDGKPCWHNYVLYSQDNGYTGFTKLDGKTRIGTDIKERIKTMEGTDIITYPDAA